jgi:hypothetical protein
MVNTSRGFVWRAMWVTNGLIQRGPNSAGVGHRRRQSAISPKCTREVSAGRVKEQEAI